VEPSRCAADVSCAQVCGARTPARWSIAVFVCIASDDQSFGNPYVFPLDWNAWSSRG
jgi:hypothetical protein